MLMSEKQCKGLCGEVKTSDQFSIDVRSKDGLYDKCKKCWREYLAERNSKATEKEFSTIKVRVHQALWQRGLMTWEELIMLLPANKVKYRIALGKALRELGAYRAEGPDMPLSWTLEPPPKPKTRFDFS